MSNWTTGYNLFENEGNLVTFILFVGLILLLAIFIAISKYYLKLFDWLDFSIKLSNQIVEKFPENQFKEKEDITNLDMTLFWYPVALSKDVTKTDKKPTSIKLLDEPLVLYRTGDGSVMCTRDVCPHSSAKLSTGQINDFEGQRSLECSYHGWRFGNNGECLRIPSVSSEKMKGLCSTIRCQLKQTHECFGMIWVFPNDGFKADINQIPSELFRESLLTEDSSKLHLLLESTRDVSCHYSFLLENVLDVAHLDFTHDGTIGSKLKATQIQTHLLLSKDTPLDDPIRKLLPKDMHYDQTIHRDSFTFRITKPEFKKIPTLKSEFFVHISFIPPCFVRLDNTDYIANDNPGHRISQLFCMVPSGKGETRILFTFHSSLKVLKLLNKISFIQRKFKEKTDSVFDQDLELLSGVSENVMKNGARVFSKLVSADAPVKAYRDWEVKMLKCNEKGGIYFKGWEPIDMEDLCLP